MVMLTTTEAVFELSAMLAAVIVICVSDPIEGAVKRPADEIVPAVVDQVTPVFVVPLIAALNCCDPPVRTVALVGSMVILIGLLAACGAPAVENILQPVHVLRLATSSSDPKWGLKILHRSFRGDPGQFNTWGNI